MVRKTPAVSSILAIVLQYSVRGTSQAFISCEVVAKLLTDFQDTFIDSSRNHGVVRVVM